MKTMGLYRDKSGFSRILLVMALLLSAALVLGGCAGKEPPPVQASAGDTAPVLTWEPGEGDLVIPLEGISATATFYPVEIDGTSLEVLAVQASDGSIRTAFNTCQVCYDSGRGYYEQQGGALVCQNCGNRFAIDQIEMRQNGCNPVPISAEYKIVTEASITISQAFLNEAKIIFSNWRPTQFTS
jgi:uncharacterized membrane protein